MSGAEVLDVARDAIITLVLVAAQVVVASATLTVDPES